ISIKWAVATLGVVVIGIIASVAALSMRPDTTEVRNFADCKVAGGIVMESYPERCRLGDATFTNEDQVPLEPSAAGKYVGMTESEALAQAKASDIPARVVQRDDEALPVTMDFVFGRYNFYVKDGEVYKVEIEGQ